MISGEITQNCLIDGKEDIGVVLKHRRAINWHAQRIIKKKQ